MSTAIVVAYPRVHVGLLDLGHTTARKYGGAGIVLDSPSVFVSATIGGPCSVLGIEGFTDRDRADVLRVIEDARSRYGLPALRVEIDRRFPPHVGLGSKTSILMACAAAITRVSGLHLTADVIQQLSGRGGVSGIGLHGFFLGGMIVDAGHPQELSPHRPSSASRGSNAPLMMLQAPVERSWSFYLLLPLGREFSGGAEVDLFERSTPLTREDVLGALSVMYHGIVPAVLTRDLSALRNALADFHNTGFKRVELLNQASSVRDLLTALGRLDGLAVGMSSLGPLVYAISDRSRPEVEPLVLDVCAKHGARLLAVCPARNEGYRLEVT